MRLKWPLAVSPTGSLAAVEQDSDDDIEQAIRAILGYRVEDRWDLPEMGMADPSFEEMPVDLSAIREVLDRHEPRAHVLLDGGDELLEDMVTEVRAEWDRAQSEEE